LYDQVECVHNRMRLIQIESSNFMNELLS
jgi:hypothetical protein